MPDDHLDNATISALVDGRHGDPFAVLGPHAAPTGVVVRALLPGARKVEIMARHSDAVVATMTPVYQDILFEAWLNNQEPYRLKIDWNGAEQITEDPYSFPPLLSDFDLHLLEEGTHHDLARCMGAQLVTINETPGVRFAVWAPNARRVSVVGDFNSWDGRRHPMRLRHNAGVWELFIPRLGSGLAYKYEILGPHGLLPLKADPIARQTEIPPATASIISDPLMPAQHAAPLRQTETPGLDKPLSIYEVHAPSWMRHFNGKSYNWDELAQRLIPYASDLGFTHIELMPIMGHPFGGSWGYQPLSQFAPMPALGTPQDFFRFVDRCHEAGLGVILDWVPAHFPNDTHGLAQFDGTPLYEHADLREGFHQDWNTLIFNLGRNEVREFLIASALFWLEHFGVDGIRVDAVASMLYRDYSRKADEWIPNIYGGRENLEAVSFLRDLSKLIEYRCPGALLIAEESTAWPGVTRSAADGGLGFTHKWNMGWMHDTLQYIQEDPINRRYHHDEMTFGLLYAFSERFILPISHDEVVNGKRSLLGRMPGDDWQRFANLRAYLAFMWTHPGKKLLFMGCEFGQPSEWNHDAQLSWHLLQYDAHRGIQGTVRTLNQVYRNEPALYERDFDTGGFRWVIGDDRDQSIFAYLRFGHEGTPPVLVVCNFTPVPRYNYRIGVPDTRQWREIFNSDAKGFGGSDVGNAGPLTPEEIYSHGMTASIELTLPPLATIILRQES
jgi:1,4-alpha-glucan branching enzyme